MIIYIYFIQNRSCEWIYDRYSQSLYLLEIQQYTQSTKFDLQTKHTPDRSARFFLYCAITASTIGSMSAAAAVLLHYEQNKA